MPLNTSGPISLAGSTAGQSIALELGESATGTISLNDAAVRDLAGVASGAIVIPTNFYGASSGPTLTLGSEQGIGVDNITQVSVGYNELRNRVTVFYGKSASDGLFVKTGAVSSGEFITYGSEVSYVNNSIVGEVTSVYQPFDDSTAVFYRENDNSNRGVIAAFRVNTSGVPSRGSLAIFGAGNDLVTIFPGNNCFFDPDTEYSACVYRNGTNSSYGEIQVGSVKNNNTLAYNEQVFNSGPTEDISAAYDTNQNQALICYTNAGSGNHGTARVCGVGTTSTFGTAVVYSSQSTFNNTVVFDGTNNKMVVIYEAGNDVIIVSWEDRESSPDNGMCVIGTVSGTDISFSGLRVLEGGNITNTTQVYDPDTAKTIISYKDVDATNTGRAKIATVVPA